MDGELSAIVPFPFGVAWTTTVFLLSLRLGAVFMMTPLLAPASVPVVVRIFLTLGLAAALALGLPATVGFANEAATVRSLAEHPAGLIQAGLIELALGATLAVGIHAAFAMFAMAGRLLDIQIGFGLAQVVDPASNTQLPILSTAFNQTALLVFFLINGHHALMRGIAYSLERFPLGRPWPIEAAFAPIMKQMLGLFGLSFSLAAPVVFCILLVEMALGVLARNLPQMNMLTMGIPIKIIVGLVALSLWFTGVGSVMNRVYASIYTSWDATFAAAPDANVVQGR